MKKIIILSFLILIPFTVSANSILEDQSFYPDGAATYEESCIADGSCSLDQGFNTFVVLAQWGLGILGSASLLFFIVGGIMWLTSGGKADQIAKGKSIMINTVIGIIIVMGAWLIVQTVLTSISERSLDESGGQIVGPCQGLEDGNSCRSGLGLCSGGVCIQKCNATPPAGGGFDCREKKDCAEGTVHTGLCFGPSNIVCCQQGSSE